MAAMTQGFREAFFENLASIEDGHYWFESRNRLIVSMIERYFPDARTMLEVGCGTGVVLRAVHAAFPDIAQTGTDFMSSGLAFAGTRVPSARLIEMDARQHLAAPPFDLVAAFDVLEHIPEDNLVLQHLFESTRPGGGLMLTVPQHPALWSRMDEYACHVRRYRRKDLIQRVRLAGFEVIRETSFVSLVLPLMAMARWRDRRRRRDFDPNRELIVAAPLNAALRAVLTTERWLIGAGLSWPAGGSLLVIARRPATGS